MPALALTDHGSLFGAIEFYKEAERAGIKPIIGIEAYVTERSRFEKKHSGRTVKNHHLTLLARNEEGYRNLIRLSSKSFLEGFYYKPRADVELLAEHSGGLIALSGCLGGAIPQQLMANDMNTAEKLALQHKDWFGDGNFFLEIMRTGLPGQEEINQLIIELGRKTDIPLVATNDVHYLEQSDHQVHDVMLCINTGHTLSDQKRMKMETDQFYFRTAEEMADLFNDIPQALENTVRIADGCNLKLEFGQYHLPEFKPENGDNPEGYLRKLCSEGAKNRFDKPSREIRDRLDLELDVIISMGFASYFLIVWDMIKFAKSNNVPVGPGRGSAAGSLVAYCLEITNVNPLDYGLIFERFLNSSRISMPDIDIDFCRNGRERVIRYVQEKYGKSSVCQIVTFGTMAARAAIRDAGRVLGIELQKVDGIAKKIPSIPGTKLKDALENDPELKKLRDTEPEIKKLFEISSKIEGLNRHASTHAAGVVITDKPLVEYVPLCRVQNEINTQYQMTALEDIGLLKMDFLGLKNLTILDKTVALIKETTGQKVNLAELSFDDPKTYELLQSGRTLGIFQLESEGMSNLIVRLKPDTFEDIIALLALYRPGPLNSGMVDSYVNRKHGIERVDYLHPSLEEVLEETYGVIVYQEQVMQIANILSGFSMNDADSLRKAMGKKKVEVMVRFRDMFIDGAVSKGVGREKASNIYDKIEFFAGYGFNKSHSTAYGIITYHTAYLKTHYPIQYMASLMTCDASDSDKVAEYIQECELMDIQVLVPDFNESDHDFSISGSAIRFGLSAIKGIGNKAIESIIDSRRRCGGFRSIQHMLTEVDLKAVNKTAIEALIKAGAFDSSENPRAALYQLGEGLIRWAAGVQADRLSGQKGLFGKNNGEMEIVIPDNIEEWEENEKLAHEKKALGFIISVNPLKEDRELLGAVVPLTAEKACELKDGTTAVFGGTVSDLRTLIPKKGRKNRKKMAMFKIRTMDGTMSCVAFSKEYEKYEQLLHGEHLLVFEGSLDNSQKGIKPSLKTTCVYTLDEYIRARFSMLILRLGSADEVSEKLIGEIKRAAEEFSGSGKLLFCFESKGEKPYSVKAGPRFNIEISEASIRRFDDILGPGRVGVRW